MRNPWLDIPFSDYEGHMNAPDVDQLSFLSACFKEALNICSPSSIALLGCATGNGLEHLHQEQHRSLHITAVDINPSYLDVLRQRHVDYLPNLNIIQADLEDSAGVLPDKYDLIFAGLVFEYVKPRIVLPKIAENLETDGQLFVILQQASPLVRTISKTNYTSLNALQPIMSLVEPRDFSGTAREYGLSEVDADKIQLPSGKEFYKGIYAKTC